MRLILISLAALCFAGCSFEQPKFQSGDRVIHVVSKKVGVVTFAQPRSCWVRFSDMTLVHCHEVEVEKQP